jgi:AcrR family transcriptional regulator
VVAQARRNTASGQSHEQPAAAAARARRGRPRSARAHQAILDAFLAQLITNGFADLRLEHVAAHAGVGKATIYRRWSSKGALALALFMQLAAPPIAIEDVGDTRAEMLAAVTSAMRAVTATPFGPVIRALLSHIASNTELGDAFRASVVQGCRDDVARVIARGIDRSDLRADADVDLATELLVGPVYFRLMFGGELSKAVAARVVDAVLRS